MRLSTDILLLLLFSDDTVLQCERCIRTFATRHITATDVVTCLDSLDDSGVGGRTTYLQFLHFLDQRCFVVSRRRSGEALAGDTLVQFQRFTFVHSRHQSCRLLLGIIVGGLHISTHKTVKEHHLTTCYEQAWRCRRNYLYTRLLQLSIGHLRSKCTLADKVVELALILVVAGCDVVDVCRTDSLMSFLCTLAGRVVITCLVVLRTIGFYDLLLGRTDRER